MTHKLPGDVSMRAGRMSVKFSSEAGEWVAYCACDAWIAGRWTWREAMDRLWQHHYVAHTFRSPSIFEQFGWKMPGMPF